MDEKHYLYDETEYDTYMSLALSTDNSDVARALEEAAGEDGSNLN